MLCTNVLRLVQIPSSEAHLQVIRVPGILLHYFREDVYLRNLEDAIVVFFFFSPFQRALLVNNYVALY